MRYFARVAPGTEPIAWRELAQLANTLHIATDHRRLDFDYPGQPANLLALRSIDDVFADVGKLQPIGRSRATLKDIAQGIAALDFMPAVDACRQVRKFPKRPHYTITASLLGDRNFNRFEVAEAVRKGLSHYGWPYVENAPEHAPVDLDIRILIENNWLVVGIRLGAYPVHRRPYKLNSVPGSLKPPVAYCLSLLAEIQPGDVVLDPMCGAGTIPVEATAFSAGAILAADLDPRAADAARLNIANAGLPVPVLVADARNLPLPDGSVDRIVSNLPWGNQVASNEDLPDLYAGLVFEFERILRPGGRCVLLTDRGDLLRPAIDFSQRLSVVSKHPISLYGSHPKAYSIERV